MTIEDVLEALPRWSGLVEALGIEPRIDEEGLLRCRMPTGRVHGGAPGIAHGGAIMSLLDTALGMEAMRHALDVGKVTSTVELKVNLLRPVPIGQTLNTRTRVQHAGRSLLVVSGEAFDEESGEQIAFAVGTFNVYRPKGVHHRAPETQTR